MKTTTVRLQPEIEEGLEAIAGKLHRSKSWLINQALREYLARQALEQTRWQETLQAMESVAKGRVVASEPVHDWLMSWGTPEERRAPKTQK